MKNHIKQQQCKDRRMGDLHPSSLLVFDYHHQSGCNKCQQLEGHISQSQGEPKKAHNCLLYLLTYAFPREVETCKLLFRFFSCTWFRTIFLQYSFIGPNGKKLYHFPLFRAAPSMMPDIWVSKE